MDNSFLLDTMEWSYSRVSSFDQCPRMFELEYMDCESKVNNAFAQWGTLAHSLFERYFKGDVDLWDLPELYEKEYSSIVTEPFVSSRLESSYYDRGLEYFSSFNGKIADEQSVIAVEGEYSSTLRGLPVRGIIDLVLQNKNGLIVCDHKSRGKWKSPEERQKLLRQLYLYAERVKEKFGEYPRQLWVNKFREGVVDVEPFSPIASQNALDWFERSVENIYNAKEFPAHPDKFFCDNLCSVRFHCENSASYIPEEDL